MSTYHDVCEEMGSRGAYLTDPVGKCQRHHRAFQGDGRSRIDKYLRESLTYEASLTGRNLAAEFDPSDATPGILEWIEDRKTALRNRFPIVVDEKHGIVKQPNKECYALLADVVGCLFRKSQDGTLVPWEDSEHDSNARWQELTQEEIQKADDSLTTFGTVSSRRFWQQHWRTRVEARWGAACVVTGCRDRRLLRAAHIKRVSVSSTAERLDANNGLILAGHIDLAFEHGLISFSDAGEMIFSPRFSLSDRNAIGIPSSATLSDLSQATCAYLQWHRRFHGFDEMLLSQQFVPAGKGT